MNWNDVELGYYQFVCNYFADNMIITRIYKSENLFDIADVKGALQIENILIID